MKNCLERAPFSQLLEAQLDEAARALGTTWVGLAERWLHEGEGSAPSYRAGSGGRVPAPRASFEPEERDGDGDGEEQWVVPVGERLTLPDGVVAGDAAVVRLDVRPRLTARDDAWLVIAPAACAVGPALDELKRLLEPALSEVRHAELSRVVLSAVEQAPDPFELSDREGRLFFVNGAWERFAGYAASESLGATAGQLFRDPVGTSHDEQFYRFAMSELHAGRPWLGAIAGKVKGGRRVFCEAHVAPFEVSPGGPRGHVAIRRDLTDRAQRDLALLAAHSEFRAVLAALTDGVCVLREGRIYFTNERFTQIMGVSPQALTGRAFVELLHVEDRAHFQQAHAKELTRVRALRPDGSLRFVEISRAGEVSFDGHPATILLARDTTDYQLAQEELARAEKLSALGSLAAGVAHEINNPLAYVALNLELLREHGAERLDPDEREALSEAIEGVARMRELTLELHTFSGRDEPGRPVAVDLTRAVTSAINIVSNDIRHRATLSRELEPGLYVLAREGQLVQVLLNVLVNAAQAIPAPSGGEHWIRIATRAGPGGMVEITVADSGVGIPAHALPRLFEPFSTSKRRGEGAGLGLAICKRIVDELEGEIEVESAVGAGTTVTIRLPEAAPPRPLTSAPPPRRVRDVPPLRVLIVEDEPPIARALERLLSGHRITRADNGEAALRLLEAGADFDLVLCDLMMPRVSGAELHRQASERFPSLAPRFVIMTGGALTADSREFLDGFGGPILSKPFTPEAVAACVEAASSRARGQPGETSS